MTSKLALPLTLAGAAVALLATLGFVHGEVRAADRMHQPSSFSINSS